MAAAVMMLLAGVLTFDTLPAAVAPTLAMIVVHAIETMSFRRWLSAGARIESARRIHRRAAVGLVVGNTGALIAVPCCCGLRIACHRIRAMRKWGGVLDRGGEIPSLRSLLRAPLSQVRPQRTA